MLGEAATTEITRADDANGFQENKRAAHKGGEVAGKARKNPQEGCLPRELYWRFRRKDRNS